MGIVDPMIIGNAANGVIQYGGAEMLAVALMSVLGVAAVGLGVSALRQLGVRLPAVPRSSGLRLATAGGAAK